LTAFATAANNGRVTPTLQLATAIAVPSAIAWSTMAAGPALAVSALVGASAMAWAGLQMVSVQSQWVVPTVFELPADARDLALTFDDGPDPATTPAVLELLAEHGARATFFMVGRRAEEHPELVRRVHAAGHQIGSHSYAHGHGFHFLGARAMAAEIERGIASIAAITGERPRAFRPPVGLRVPTLRAALLRLPEPVTCYTWTERGLDTLGRPAAAIVARLEPHLRAGAILTLHDGAGLGGTRDRSATVLALRELLARMRTNRLQSRRLDRPHPDSVA
jgi:peptidoglycan/xylan/chitin deacetylase (PgdA/CDA1 family)